MVSQGFASSTCRTGRNTFALSLPAGNSSVKPFLP
jgi:hypothetical protein